MVEFVVDVIMDYYGVCGLLLRTIVDCMDYYYGLYGLLLLLWTLWTVMNSMDF